MTARIRVATAIFLTVLAARGADGLYPNSHRTEFDDVQSRSASVSLGDLNGDGVLDMAVANGRHWPQQNRVFFGVGDASFGPAVPLGAVAEASYITALGDLDGDGDLDIAVGNDRSANPVFLNDGNGRFLRHGTFGEPTSIRSLALADVDGDEDLDVLANARGRQNRIYLNDGRAQFSDSRPFGAPADSTIHTAVGDLNGDGHIDLILANRDGQANAVLLNDGTGRFLNRIPFGSGSDETRSVAVADFNADGRLDWVIGNIGQRNQVFFGDGQGGSSESIAFGSSDGLGYSVAVADLDLDGGPDLVVGNAGQVNEVYFNRRDGREWAREAFGAPTEITYHVAVGDLNQDGFPDIVSGNSDGRNVVHWNVPSADAQAAPLQEGSGYADDERPHWPSFRGWNAGGVADSHPLPTTWNADPSEGEVSGVLWRTPIPGLGHSSPVIWGDKVFVCTAERAAGDSALTLNGGGRPTAADDSGLHRWLVLCYDKRTGEEIWRRVATEGEPRATRHAKATQANTSVAVDGRHVVAFFGSEGIHCYDLDGHLLWRRDLGVVDISKYGIGWGYASSPAIHGNRIVVLCDDPERPFVAALRLKDGREVWRVSREGISDRSWGTPLILPGGEGAQVVVNGWPVVVSYDLANGDELWRIHDGGDNPIPTPFLADGLIYIASAHGPKSPVYAVRPEARGDITPTRDQPSNDGMVWSVLKGGSYMSTPVVYRGQIYLGTYSFCRSFDSRTGAPIFDERLPRGAAITASLVAGDGKVYLASEDGMVHVLRAGETFKVLASNPLGEPCLASPAISEGALFFRTTKSLIAVH